MPGCAAVGCSNSSKKGYLMKRFPKDLNRRKEWAARTKRGQWFPTDSSVLCEAHFEPEMWEKTREDGTRRLRTDAVPTIFFIQSRRKRKIKNKTTSFTSPKIEDVEFIKIEPTYVSEITIGSYKNMEIELNTEDVDDSGLCMPVDVVLKEHSYAGFEPS